MKARVVAKRKRAPSGLVLSVSGSWANDLATFLAKELEGLDPSERESFINCKLQDELPKYFFDVMANLLGDASGQQYFRKVGSRAAARVGAEKRMANSAKSKFIRWARERLAQEPSLKKAALVREYEKKNPGVSPPTLRRYITDL